jgi:hypothetical protein
MRKAVGTAVVLQLETGASSSAIVVAEIIGLADYLGGVGGALPHSLAG